MAVDRPQKSRTTFLLNQALPAEQCVHEFLISSLAWSDDVGHVYVVRSRQSFASKDGDEAEDAFPQYELLLRELMPQALCARATDTDKIVARAGCEILFEKCRERFLAEGKALVGLGGSKGLLQVLRVFEHNGTAYQLVEKPTGQSLRSRIDSIKHGRSEKFSTRELSEILCSVLTGLQRAHSLNLLHRNINPDCIYLDDENGAKLGDFFAAGQVLRSHEQRADQISDGNLPEGAGQTYAPVELWLARGNQGCWSDLYALGASLYEAIALTPPAVATIRFEQMQSSQIDSYVPLRVILESMYPARLLEAVDWMLKANIRNRPKSVTELADFLGFELDDRQLRRRVNRSGTIRQSLSQSSRVWRAPIVRRLWRSRQRYDTSHAGTVLAEPTVLPQPDSIDSLQPDNLLHVAPPRKQRFSKAMPVALVCAVVVSAGVFFSSTDSSQPVLQTNTDKASEQQVPYAAAVVAEASSEPDAIQPETSLSSVAPATRQATKTTMQSTLEARAADDRSARTLAKKARVPLQGVRRDRYVARHLGEAEQAWRDGRLLVPGKGSVLRHLERVIDVDPGNVEAVAGVNHLLYHFIAELQKAETSGDAVAIRYLNRNIRRVRLRHPASVPKSHQRFASLPAPPPPSTRMAGVAAANLRPDYTE